MADYSGYDPNQDPSRRKSAALQAQPGTSVYPGQVQNYNQWLYTPMDQRPTPTAPSMAHQSAYATGWQGASSPVAAGSYQTPYGPASVNRVTPDTYGMMPQSSTIAPNPAGGRSYQPGASTAPFQYGPPAPQSSGFLGIGSSASQAQGNTPIAPPSPPQNAMQRWQASASGVSQEGIRPISDQRRYFWATNHIDARAPQAQPPQGLGTNAQRGYAQIKFNNSPSNWSPY